MIKTSTLRAWRNSQGIIIPKEILRILAWKSSDSVDLYIDGDELRIRKKHVHKSFEDRLVAYRGELEVLHYDWGKIE